MPGAPTIERSTLVDSPSYEVAGIKFWTDHFRAQPSVPWNTFTQAYEKFLRKRHSNQLEGLTIPFEKGLKELIVRGEESTSKDAINLEEWVIFLHRFGPIECCIGKAFKSLFNEHGQLVPWFQGNISRQKAQEILISENAGRSVEPGNNSNNYLVRFSETQPKNFTLVYLNPADPCQCRHVLIYNRGPDGFAYTPHGHGTESFSTLGELIESRQAWTLPALSHNSSMVSGEETSGAGVVPNLAVIGSKSFHAAAAADKNSIFDAKNNLVLGKALSSIPAPFTLNKAASSVLPAAPTFLRKNATSNATTSTTRKSHSLSDLGANSSLTSSSLGAHIELDSDFDLGSNSSGDEEDFDLYRNVRRLEGLAEENERDGGNNWNTEDDADKDNDDLSQVGSSSDMVPRRRRSRIQDMMMQGESEDEEEEEEDEEEEGDMPSMEQVTQRLSLLKTTSTCGSLEEAARLLNEAMMMTASGRYEEALLLLDDVVGWVGDDVKTFEEAELRCKAMKVYGSILQELEETGQAMQYYELSCQAGRRALELMPAAVELDSYFSILVHTHHQLSQYYLSREVYDCAMYHYEFCLTYSEDTQERAMLLQELRTILLQQGYQQDVSSSMLEQELEVGKRHYKENRRFEALDQFVKVLRMARFSCPDRLVEARALGNYATVCRDLQDHDEAIWSYRLCCRILGALGEKILKVRMMNGLSLCYIDAKRFEDAKVVCGHLLDLSELEDNKQLIRRRITEIEQLEAEETKE